MYLNFGNSIPISAKQQRNIAQAEKKFNSAVVAEKKSLSHGISANIFDTVEVGQDPHMRVETKAPKLKEANISKGDISKNPGKRNTAQTESSLSGIKENAQETLDEVNEQVLEPSVDATGVEFPKLELPTEFKSMSQVHELADTIQDIYKDTKDLAKEIDNYTSFSPANFTSDSAKAAAQEAQKELRAKLGDTIIETGAGLIEKLETVAEKTTEIVEKIMDKNLPSSVTHALEEVAKLTPVLSDIKNVGSTAHTAFDLQVVDARIETFEADLKRLNAKYIKMDPHIFPSSFEDSTYLNRQGIGDLQIGHIKDKIEELEGLRISKGMLLTGIAATLLAPVTLGASAAAGVPLTAMGHQINKVIKATKEAKIEELQDQAQEVKDSEASIKQMTVQVNTIAEKGIQTRAAYEEERNASKPDPKKMEKLESQLLKTVEDYKKLKDKLIQETATHNVLSKRLMQNHPREVVTQILEGLCFEKKGAGYKPSEIKNAIAKILIDRDSEYKFKGDHDMIVELYKSGIPAKQEQAIIAMSGMLGVEYLAGKD